MKIGIVGGTFNPIHLGHLMLGEYAYKELELDEIWFVPNGNPPHKQLNSSEISTDMRVEMTEIAIADTEYFKVNTYEITNKRVSYSYETLEIFHMLYPDYEYYFIIGSDSLFSIEQWRYPERLLKSCTILVACRENMDIQLISNHIDYLEQKFGCRIILLQMPLLEVSSSDIRNRVASHKSIRYIVPDSIYHYIKKHKLYGV